MVDTQQQKAMRMETEPSGINISKFTAGKN
jgi:hypothetical protein